MKRNVIYPRQDSLVSPVVENPFVHRLNWTVYDYIKVALMSITIAPIRLILVGICLLAAWPLAAIAVGFRSEADRNKPLAGWRNFLRPFVVFFCRAMFFMGGFHWITVRGKRVTSKVAPIIAMAPHSSYFDALPVVYLNLDTVVAKAETDNVPLFGTLMQFTQPVYVKREDPDSRVNTIKEISRRAQSKGEWPQVIIFPEGTCTNRSCLITFKPGAFYPGQPVQPVCIRYPNKFDTITWTWEGPGAFTLLWLTLCQFHNYMEIEYLPVYYPTPEDKQDAKVFANHVRDKMAECLKCPITDHTYDDCRLMVRAAKLNLPMATGLVEFHKLHKKLGISFAQMHDHLEKFRKITDNKAGSITIKEFAMYLRLPVSSTLQEIFDTYDRNSSGTIDFREYIIGLSLVSGPANTEDTIKLAFQLFDSENNGYITEDGLTTILHNAFGMNKDDVHELFEDADKDKDGKISYDEFQQQAADKPDYAKIFVAYQNMVNKNGHPEPAQEENQKAKTE
ncbi:lysophosphatidylcholine acyltransferase 2 isoform X1 [Patella vulgata]|uniref:lysophosphatidylcholine acyltransferase 2 isoform X1 n=2 Tax=Patella vulgata TaxID=6465 RepID=UPI00217FC7E2|nr:lysophosphatidylcholine acyltransferase 2 isoform X1 [Patella vulgata]